MPWAKVVTRSFLSADGTVMGGVFDIRARGAMRFLQLISVLPRRLRAVEFETELSDGTFVTTSDAKQASKASEFTGISRQFLPQGTAPAKLFEAHQHHLRAQLDAKPDVTPMISHTAKDLWASQDRQQMIKSRHRNSAEYDPAENVARIVGKPLNELQRAAAEEAAALHAERLAGRQQTGQQFIDTRSLDL
jgi:hypothetical protein